MPGFWAGRKFQYRKSLIEDFERKLAAATEELENADTLSDRERCRSQIDELRREHKHSLRNIGELLY